MRRAMYIGRFQIFHLGHVDVIRHIDAAPDIDEIVLAVGSTQYDHHCKSPRAPWACNPFTYEERAEMIQRSLVGQVRKPWSLHPLPDYHDCAKWYAHILLHLPAFDCLYTSSQRERSFFSARGKEVRGFPRRFAFHGGSLRQLLADGRDVRPHLPAGTIQVLERIGAEQRMREAFARDATAGTDSALSSVGSEGVADGR